MFTVAKPAQVVAEATIDAGSVANADELDVTATVNGLTPDMAVYVNWPSLEAGLGIMYAEVSAANTLKVRLRNFTGSPIDPASATVKVLGF